MPELRIVAGEWRGRRIKVPAGAVRPTADRVREAWMSIVMPALDGARVLDLCSGSGALGLEALSRGAAHCDFVEREPRVLTTLRLNLATLGAETRATVHRADAVRFVTEREPGAPHWDVAFADPPYGDDTAAELAACWLRTPFATIFGVEHAAGTTLPDATTGPPGATADRRVYGGTAITILRTDS
jgi:16S rRNA (guanine966-N2)-methyltransferase